MRHVIFPANLLGALAIGAVAISDPMGAAVLSGLAAVLGLGVLGWIQTDAKAPERPLTARSFDRRRRSGRLRRQNPPGGRSLLRSRDA